MLSPELEKLIDLAVADGEITEQERNVLYRKAQETGADMDEFEMTLNAKLFQAKKELAASAPAPAPAPKPNSKHGELRKCPNCGAVVESGSPTCADCGYAFAGLEANSSIQKLAAQINKVEEQYNSSGNPLSFSGIAASSGMDARTKKLNSIINNFPVPTTREDLLEFILFLKPKTDKWKASSGDIHLVPSYKRKYNECIEKAKLFFPDDPQFKVLIGSSKEKKGFFGKLFGK